MALEIKDGEGQGYVAGVNQDNRLLTTAVTQPIEAFRSRAGVQVGMGTGFLTIPGDSAERRVLWIQNTAASQTFHIARFIWTWSGGATTGLSPLRSLIYYAASEPTTNTSPRSAFPENQTATFIPQLNILAWDEVGAGMTGGTAGNPAIPNQIPGGTFFINIGGQIILGPTQIISFNFTADEAGEGSVAVVGWFEVPGLRL